MNDPILSKAERAALVRRDFATFVKLVFKELNPGTPLIWDPYLDVVCANLQAVVLGGTRRLGLALPPRHLKSECGTIALSAFFLGHFPDKTVMAVSYGRDLALTLARKTRKVMQSAWYKEAFPTRLENPRGAADMIRTVQGGLRQATSIDGAATGFGSDLMIFDDPQKAADVSSGAPPMFGTWVEEVRTAASVRVPSSGETISSNTQPPIVSAGSGAEPATSGTGTEASCGHTLPADIASSIAHPANIAARFEFLVMIASYR